MTGVEATFVRITDPNCWSGAALCTLRLDAAPVRGVSLLLPGQGRQRWLVEHVLLDLSGDDNRLPVPAEVLVLAVR